MSAVLEILERPSLDQAQELERLDDLRSLELLDTPSEERFDRITRLASDFFQVPTAFVALIDGERQWFKSRQGLCLAETPRAISFCQYTIQRDTPLIIPDTYLNPASRTHPMVVGEPYIRFYAGIPLSGPRGKKIGTFCLADVVPRKFGEEEIAQLTIFAALIEREINLGQIIQTQNELLQTRERLIETQGKLDQEFSDAVSYIRSILPPPLKGGETIDWQFHPSTHLGGDGLGYRRIDGDRIAFYILDVTGHGLGSALLAVSVMELLRLRTATIDFSKPGEVLERLNRTFQMKDHAGKFLSVWYGVYSRSARRITFANAGHPPALLLTYEDGKPHLRKTEFGGGILGIVPEIQVQEQVIDFPLNSEILLFTDGLYEMLDPQSGHGSYDEFFTRLRDQTRQGKKTWDAILEGLDEAREQQTIDDDVTLLRFAATE